MNDSTAERRRRIPPPPIPTPPKRRPPKPTIDRIVLTGPIEVTYPGTVSAAARWRVTTRDENDEITDQHESTGRSILALAGLPSEAAAIRDAFTFAHQVSPLRFDGRPPAPLKADEVTKVLTMPADVRRCLLYVTEVRMLTGQGPAVNRLWSVWHHGNPDQPATETPDRTTRDGWVLSKIDGVLRPPKADARHLLSWLSSDWFVRHSPDPGSVKLRGLVYQLLRPMVEQRLRAEGAWPPPERYRGPRRVRELPTPAAQS